MAQSKSQILKKLAKKLPDGAVYSLAEQESVEFIPTGISTLDYALGTGGWARGWMTQLYGPSSSGKSAMVLQSIGNYQKNNPDSLAAVVDLEKSMSVEWAVKFGIDPDRLIILRPTNVEEMITMSMEAVKANAFDIIMVDSLGAGLLQSEIENDKSRMAGSAGAITRMVKAINAAFIELERDKKVAIASGSDSDDYIVPAVILINQVRVNMSSMYGEDTYGGGKALGHMLGVNIHLRASKASADKIMGTVDGQQLRVGWMCTATVEKNKLSTPGKSAGYSFVFCECPEYEFGIDNARSVADLALATGVARVEGKSIYYPTPSGAEEKVVGRNNFQQLMRENEELIKFLAEEISRDISKNSCDEDAITVQKMNDCLDV